MVTLHGGQIYRCLCCCCFRCCCCRRCRLLFGLWRSLSSGATVVGAACVLTLRRDNEEATKRRRRQRLLLLVACDYLTMFWRNIYTPSRIDTLLENENVTLKELLEEDDVVQECKSANKKLIDFLARPEIVESLMKMALDEPTDECSEKLRFKYSNVACELMTSDVNQITDILVTDPLVLPLLSFLERPEPLNPLQASFFSKIMGLLITRKSDAILELIKSRDGFLGHVLRHLGTSAVMDLLLRLMTCVDAVECRVKYIKWLNDEKLVQHLVNLISSSETPERITNASQTLCDIIRLGKDSPSSMPDEPSLDILLKEVEKGELLLMLLDRMFDGGNSESAIVNGLYVLQALLEPKRTNGIMSEEKNDPSDVEQHIDVQSDICKTLAQYVKHFHNLLLNPPKQHYMPMLTSLGPVVQPLGLTRLQVASLFTLLVAADNSAVNAEITSLCTVGCLLNLFFQYPWNNFLHTQVEHCITTVINQKTPENPLLVQLVKDFDLLRKIVEAFDESQDQQQERQGKQRLGHLGHLTRIANLVASKAAMDVESHPLAKLFKELSDDCQLQWNTFVGGKLSDVNHTNSIELGGTSNRSGRILSSSDDDDDIGYLNFPMDDNLQKAFADYQTQQMTSNFVDHFGFSEEEISEQEESFGLPFMTKISSIDFELNLVEDNPTAAAMFEQACNDRIRQFDSNDSDEDSEMKEILAFSNVSSLLRHSSVNPDGENRQSFNNCDSYEDEEEFVAEEMEDNNGSTDEEEEVIAARSTWKANEGKAGSRDVDITSESANNEDITDTSPATGGINGEVVKPDSERSALISGAVESSNCGTKDAAAVGESANGISLDAIDVHLSNELSSCSIEGHTDHEVKADLDTNSS